MKDMADTSPIFVIFGATGDLAQKKIFPALEALYAEGALSEDPRIVGVSRRAWNDADFEAFLREHRSVSSAEFLKRVSYAQIDIAAGTGYEALAASLHKLRGGAQKRQVVYYTSLAPELHGEAIRGLLGANLLYRAGEAKRDGLAQGPAPKLLIEKPFGTDLKTARALDRLIGGILDDDQVYRVDHYLGKDTVRALMDLHESTPELSRLFSTESVAEIRVRLLEEKGIDGRGASYDHVGAFRDVGQNHMLEMLAIVAADLSEGRASWQKARADVLERLAPPAKTCELSRRGQYAGYHAERGVRPGSETETAFEVITNLRGGKLSGVPLVLESGKKMPTSEALIEVTFKDVSGLPKRMLFRVQPEQEIVIENRDGSSDRFDVPRARDAYGNVILDALRGSERAFVGGEEIEALWAYADHIVACWGKVPLEIYGQTGADGEVKPFLIE